MAVVDTILAGALASLFALIPLARWGKGTVWHAIAGACVLYPVMEDLVGFVNLAPALGRPTVLRPYAPEQLAEIPWRITRENLAVPLVGLGVVALVGGAVVARRHLEPVTRGASSWGSELWLGLGIVPLVVGAEAVAIWFLQGPGAFLQTADESALFLHATWIHVLALSLVPGVVEELYYRGFVQGLLERMLPGAPRQWGAIVIQGILFGFAHAGYTSYAHLLGPLAFGLAMGYLRSVVGLGACMMAHAGVNLFYFSIDPGAGSTGLLVATIVISAIGLAVLALERRTYLARVRAGPKPA